MRILLIAHFADGASDGHNNRFNYLQQRLCRHHDVTLVTSRFGHRTKRHRVIDEHPRNVVYIDEPGYERHISVRRLVSHAIMANNLRDYLQALTVAPDIVYCAVPSLGVGKVAARFAAVWGVPLVIDIQDLWPEAFHAALPVPMGKALLRPLRKRADDIYRSAAGIVAVSDSYAQVGLRSGRPDRPTAAVYLGADLNAFGEPAMPKAIGSEFRVAYVGTLGATYAVDLVILAIARLRSKHGIAAKLLAMGDGPTRGRLERLASEHQVAAEFTGALPYAEMCRRLAQCDVAVNPIRRISVASVINKVGDYAAAGLPVVNTQPSPEYRALLESYAAGISCRDDADEICAALKALYENPGRRAALAGGARVLAREQFDRGRTYERIENLIEGLRA